VVDQESTTRTISAAQRAATVRVRAIAEATAKAQAAQAAAAAAAVEAAAAKADLEAARHAAAERLRLKRERDRKETEAAEAEETARAEAAKGKEAEALRNAAERLRVEKEKKEDAVIAEKVKVMSKAQVQRAAEESVKSLMARHQAEEKESLNAEEKEDSEAERLYAEADNRATRQVEAQLTNMLKEVRDLEVMRLTTIDDELDEPVAVGSDLQVVPLSRQKSVLRRGSIMSVASELPALNGHVDRMSQHSVDGPSEQDASRVLSGASDGAAGSCPGLVDQGEDGSTSADQATEPEDLMAPILEQLRHLESTWEEWAGPDGATMLSAASSDLRNWACWCEKSGLGETLGSLHTPASSVSDTIANSVSLLERALSLPYEPWEKLAKRVKPWQAMPGSTAAVNLQALRSYRQTQIELIAARMNPPDRPKLPPVPAAVAAARRTREEMARPSCRTAASKVKQTKSMRRSDTTGSIHSRGSDGPSAAPAHPEQRSGHRSNGAILSAGACALERPTAGGWDSSLLPSDACAWSSDTSYRTARPGGTGSAGRERAGSGGNERTPAVSMNRVGSGARERASEPVMSALATLEDPPRRKARPDAPISAPSKDKRSKAQILAANEAARARVVATAILWSSKS